MCISRTGTNYGPRAIRDASDQFSFYNASTGMDLNDHYRFADCGDVPVVPGILPVTSYAQINRITSLCGAKLPKKFRSDLESASGDDEAQYHVGVDYATAQVGDLVHNNVPGMHFYVLNKSRATKEVLSKVPLPV